MCTLEFPELEKNLHDRYGDRVQIVGVNPGKMMMGGESPAMVQQFVDQTGVTFPMGFDTGETYKEYARGRAISPFPLDVIIDQQGRIVYAKRMYEGDAMVAVIDELLAQP